MYDTDFLDSVYNEEFGITDEASFDPIMNSEKCDRLFRRCLNKVNMTIHC